MMDIQNERYLQALDRIIVEKRNREGIGRLGEKLVHASLKSFYESDTAYHEIKVGGFVADILREGHITEIQTGPFTPLKKKLDSFLETHTVTVVHPIVNRKVIVWVDADGAFSKPVTSPKKRDVFGAFSKLVSVLPYLLRENLTVELVYLDIEEYRLLHPKYGKRRSTRYERVPTRYLGKTVLKTADDYAALLPETLPASFTSKEFSKLCKVRGMALSAALKVYMTLGVFSREREGRGYRYYYSKKQQ